MNSTENIRIGSPFAVDPEPLVILAPTSVVADHRSLADLGPMRYTAMGAVAASIMVIGFATASVWWFPAGGIAISTLGCVLSIFGMFSSYRLVAMGLLAVHLCLFVANYGQAI